MQTVAKMLQMSQTAIPRRQCVAKVGTEPLRGLSEAQSWSRHMIACESFGPCRPPVSMLLAATSLTQLHSSAAQALPVRQERIASDGSWSGAASSPVQDSSSQQPYVIGYSTPSPGPTAPLVPPVSDAALDRLADLLQRARGTLVLTGAGCSTESGVPDYRGPAGGRQAGLCAATLPWVQRRRRVSPPRHVVNAWLQGHTPPATSSR